MSNTTNTNEPILKENPNRFVLFPIEHNDIWEIYKRDFQLFKYDFDNPANKMPIGEIDLDEVHAKLGD